MPRTYSQLIIDQMDWLDTIADKVQPKVREAIGKGGVRVRNALDGTWLGTPLHPALTDVPVGSWTAALIFDGRDARGGDRRRFSRGRRWPLGLEVLEGRLAQDGGSPRSPERSRTQPEHNLARLEGPGPQERRAASVSGWVLARWVGSSPRRRALLRLRAQSKS